MKRLNIVLVGESEKIFDEYQEETRLKNDDTINTIIVEFNKLRKKEEKKK